MLHPLVEDLQLLAMSNKWDPSLETDPGQDRLVWLRADLFHRINLDEVGDALVLSTV